MDRELIFREIIKEINSQTPQSFHLCGNITYGNLIKDTKQLEMTDDIINQIFEFDLKVDLDFSCIDGEEKKKEVVPLDDDINQSLQNLTIICDNQHITLENFKTTVYEEDYVSKKINNITANHISNLTSTNANFNIDFSQLNEINDDFTQFIKENNANEGNEEKKDIENKEEKKLNEEKIPKTPLEFIRSFEKYTYVYEDTKESNEVDTLPYPLNDYYTNNEITIDILLQEDKGALLKRFQKLEQSNETINVFTYYKDKKTDREVIYGCTSKGKIRKYDMNNQIEIVKYEPLKESVPALCLDVKLNPDDNNTILICGFKNGVFVIYSEDHLIDNNKNIFKGTSILSIKIIKLSTKIIEFIASDLNGNVYLLKKEKKIFSSSITFDTICPPNTFGLPVYCIDYYNFKTDDENLALITEDSLLFVFVTNEYIKVAKIKPKYEEYICITKKASLEWVSDYCFGCGTIQNQEVKLLLVSSGVKIFMYNIEEMLNKGPNAKEIGIYNHQDSITKIGFLSKSFVYVIDYEKIKIIEISEIIKPKDKTKYKTEIREVFLVEEINTLINKTVNLNNTSLINTSAINNTTTLNNNNNNSSNMNQEDLKESFSHPIYDTETQKIPKRNYRKGIIKLDDGFGIFGKKRVRIYKADEWKNCIDLLVDSHGWEKWEKIFALGIELLKKDYFCNYLFPKNKNFEKNKSQYFEGAILKSYVDINKSESPITSTLLLKVCIEFCIKIDHVDWLFGQFFDLFISDKKVEFFFNSIEKFIFLDQFKKLENIPLRFIKELSNHYISQNKKLILSKSLLHFNPVALSDSEIIKIIQDNDLLSSYIYICMNNPEEEDYYKPLLLMSSNFERKSLNVNYAIFITMHDKKLYNDDMLSSKQYFGHKILWYSDLCLSGYKYPENEKMDPKKHEDIIKKIYLFLLAQADNLIPFDSFSFFEIYTRFFVEEQLYEKICNLHYKKNEDFIETINLFLTKKKLIPSVLIEYLCEKCYNYLENFFILKDLYDFLGEICKTRPEIQISKSILIDGIEYLARYSFQKHEHLQDPFSCHHQTISSFQEEDKKTERTISDILQYLKPNLTKEDIEKFDTMYELSSINLAKIFLMNLEKNYIESFEFQLKKLKEENGTKEKIRELFEWINTTFLSLRQKEEDEEFDNLKSHILDKLPELSELSWEDVTGLVDNWYSDEISQVILKMGASSTLQLKYLQTFIHHLEERSKAIINYENNIQNNVNDSETTISNNNPLSDNQSECPSECSGLSRLSTMSSSGLTDIDFSFSNADPEDIERSTSFSSSSRNLCNTTLIPFETEKENVEETLVQLKILEIKFLCQLHQKDDIYDIVSKNINTCTKEVLEILKQNKVYDSIIYICKVNGGYKQGISVTKTAIEKNFNKILRNLSNENFKEKINTILLDKHMKYLDLGISICQLISENEADGDSWVELLETLYKLKTNIQNYVQQNTNNYKTYLYTKIRDTFSESIELILSKMCEYVNLPLIIEIVTEKIKGVSIGFKEFKRILSGMCYSLNQMENILYLIRKMLRKSIYNSFLIFSNIKKKGSCIKLTTCSYCKKAFEGKDGISITIGCGHSYHKSCCAKEEEQFVCFICRREEVQASITTVEEKLMISERSKNKKRTIRNNVTDKEKIELTQKELRELDKKHRLKKLKLKSKKYRDHISLLEQI